MRPTAVRTALWLLLPLVAGCTPLTQYRRSALVPGPAVPDYTGEPRGAGHFDIGAQIGGREINERLVSQEGDPALWIPRFEINASVMGGITDWFDLGGTVMYANGAFAVPDTVGTVPLDEDRDHVWGIGPQLAFGGKFLDGLLFAGGYLALMYVQIPWATWELVDERTGEYRFQESDFDQDLLYRLGGFFGVRPLWFMSIYAGVVAQSAWINDGFSNTEADGSTLEQITPAWIPTLGTRFDFREAGVPLYVRGALTFPIENDAADYFPVGWDVSLGVSL